MASAKITDVTNIGHKVNGECYICTEIGDGWLNLDDSAQHLRIWACAAAIWAARRAGASIKAVLYFRERHQTDDNAWFEGVARIHLLE
jgi:hypothetical protein